MAPPFAFVLCPSYHGATLLAVLLNNHARISSLGDLLPSRDFVQRCSCGQMADACPFWTGLVRTLHPDGERASGNWAELVAASFPILEHDRIDRVLTLAGLLLGPWVWNLRPGRRAFLQRSLALRQAVHQAHGANLLVDGEKSLTKALLLASLDGQRSKIIHLVRDPRGFLHSCRKHMADVTLEDAARMWNHHRLIARFARPLFGLDRLLVRYEDLAADPAGTMARIFAFLGMEDADVVQAPNDPAKYHMMGNKMLATFDGSVRPDTAWRETISQGDQQRILALTAPLSQRLGYRR